MLEEIRGMCFSVMQDESGQELIEDALVVGLVALGAIAAMSGLSGTIGNTYGSIGNSLTNGV